MRVVSSVYVDHQERSKYPIEYVTRNISFCDKIYLFGSDAENADWLKSMKAKHLLGAKMEVVQINAKVSAPTDIAKAQNACLDWIRSNEVFDYYLLLQADTTLTALGIHNLMKFMGIGEPDRPVVMQKINRVHLHMDFGRTHFGIALIGKGSKDSRFVGDGAYTENYWVSSDRDDVWHAMDVSYMSVDGFARKMDVRGRVWGDQRSAGLFWEYVNNRGNFLKIALRDMIFRERLGNVPTMVSMKDPDYAEAVKHFGLEGERDIVLAAFRQAVSEGPETCLK